MFKQRYQVMAFQCHFAYKIIICLLFCSFSIHYQLNDSLLIKSSQTLLVGVHAKLLQHLSKNRRLLKCQVPQFHPLISNSNQRALTIPYYFTYIKIKKKLNQFLNIEMSDSQPVCMEHNCPATGNCCFYTYYDIICIPFCKCLMQLSPDPW